MITPTESESQKCRQIIGTKLAPYNPTKWNQYVMKNFVVVCNFIFTLYSIDAVEIAIEMLDLQHGDVCFNFIEMD